MKKQILILLAALMLSLGASAQMVLQFDTNLSDGKTVTLPLYGTVDVTVNWGDGSNNTYTEAGNQDHIYAAEGTYTVEISGSLTQFGQYNYPNADKLVKVTSFGDIGLYSLDHAFHNAVNLVEVPTQLPSSVKILESTFREAINFNFDIGGWDVSNVYNMRGLFRGASSFNQDISNWDVSNVGNMPYMFCNATAFNQNIGNWNVSNVTSMFTMFDRATSFNQNIGSWNVGKVTSMNYMFRGATAFNQDISGWDVSKVYNMNYMFSWATAFNQDISDWDVSKVLEMPSMFSNATAFNQDLGSWNVTSVTNMTDMFAEVTLSTANYNSLLIGWAAQTVQNGVVFSGGNSKYSPGAAADARAVLAGTTNNWIITDGGESNALAVSTHVVSDITTTTATSGGNVFADGGSSITARGVVWGTSENPTIETHTGITTDGSGTGAFTSSITGLAENTTYYVRAYATNADGTEYGKNKSFTAMHPMVLEFNTNLSDGTTIMLPLYGTVNATVNWGDGSSDTYTEAGNQDHTYAAEGTYTVEISGSLTQFGKYNYPNVDKLVKVTSFGDIGLHSLEHAFHNAVNLVEVPTQLPSSVKVLEFTFRDATNFNFDIGGWNVSNVINMRGLFRGASSFNQDISNWDVSNVGNMDYMFINAIAFNQDIGTWDVSNVTGMGWMFCVAKAFNQDIGAWNVSKVNVMREMFRFASSFNQDISTWDVSNVAEMLNMFDGVTLSTANYNSLLIGWAAQTVQNGVVFSGGNSKYSPGTAADARAVLTGATNGWTITDGGESSVFTVSTLAVSDIAATSATAGGNITNDGGSAVTARGVVWGTSVNPTLTVNDGKTEDGTGAGIYTSSITGLTELTTYHVRAYATNADGTEYGENREFTTSKVTSIDNFSTDNMGVYPNPFQNTINITNADNAKRVVITNVVGEVVLVVNLNKVPNPVIETNLPSGMYLVTLIANDGSRVTRKMVRE